MGKITELVKSVLDIYSISASFLDGGRIVGMSLQVPLKEFPFVSSLTLMKKWSS